MPLFVTRLCFWLCAGLLLVGGPLGLLGAQANELHAETLVQSRQWRMDKTGQDTLQDVEKATDWQDLPEWNSWGFGPETIWVRLQLRAAPPSARVPWVVRVRPPFLDYVTLYDPASDVVLRSGDALPPESDDSASINFMFQIPALAHERTVYVQMRSTSARTLQVEVMPYGQAQQSSRLQEWVVSFAMASSAIFAIWAFVQWRGTRERVMGAFALKQLVATVWSFFFLGFARVVIGPWLPEGMLTNISSTIFFALISVTLWFFSRLLAGYQPACLALRGLQVVAVVVATLPVLYWLGWPHETVALSNKAVLLGFFMMLVTMLSALRRPVRQPIAAMALLVYLLIYSTLNSLPALIHLKVIDAHAIVLFGALAHAVLDGLVMFAMLQIRARAQQKQQEQVALDLQLSQQKMQDEKRHREEQSQLFAMLAHEMKTPLATLRLWMDAGQLKPETMERAIADMNQVIERCVHTGQLADQGLQPDWQQLEPVALTQICIQSCRLPEQVDFVKPGESGTVQTDPQMLSIVLGNLLDNACKYGEPNSRIQVSLNSVQENEQAGWLWVVTNAAGPAGLPHAERLFEKYYRSPQARRLSGSGLGLFLVRGLLELMHGRVDYATRGDRAVFSVWVPQHAV
jgi:two-component system, sensor histidine kinase LadS